MQPGSDQNFFPSGIMDRDPDPPYIRDPQPRAGMKGNSQLSPLAVEIGTEYGSEI